jgi:hypothetical protein
MTRQRLWSLTAIACLLMVVPSFKLKAFSFQPSAFIPHLSAIRLPALDVSSLDPRLAIALAGTAVATLMLILTAFVLRRRRTAADKATVMARRGTPVPAIARQTRLSQDAIRDLLGGEPMAFPTGLRGRIFRRRPKTSGSAEGSFADELSEKAWDAKA